MITKIVLLKFKSLDIAKISLFLENINPTCLHFVQTAFIIYAFSSNNKVFFKLLLESFPNNSSYLLAYLIPMINNRVSVEYIDILLDISINSEIDVNDMFRRIVHAGMFTINDVDYLSTFLKRIAEKEGKNLDELFSIYTVPSLSYYIAKDIASRKIAFQMFYIAGLPYESFVAMNKTNPMLPLTEWLAQENV